MQNREGWNGTGEAVAGDHQSDEQGAGRMRDCDTGGTACLQDPESEGTLPSHLSLSRAQSELRGPLGVHATLSVPPSFTPWSSL